MRPYQETYSHIKPYSIGLGVFFWVRKGGVQAFWLAMVKVISGLGTVRLGMEMMGCISGYGQSCRRPKAETGAGDGEEVFGFAIFFDIRP